MDTQAIILLSLIAVIIFCTIFEFQKFSRDDIKHQPHIWNSNGVQFPFKFESLDEKTFLVVEKFWGKIIHLFSDRLTPIHFRINDCIERLRKLESKGEFGYKPSRLIYIDDELSKCNKELEEIFFNLFMSDPQNDYTWTGTKVNGKTVKDDDDFEW